MRSLKDIIRNDSSIMDNTVIGYCSGYEKQSILGGQVFCISSLLASVIYYACIEVKTVIVQRQSSLLLENMLKDLKTESLFILKVQMQSLSPN